MSTAGTKGLNEYLAKVENDRLTMYADLDAFLRAIQVKDVESRMVQYNQIQHTIKSDGYEQGNYERKVVDMDEAGHDLGLELILSLVQLALDPRLSESEMFEKLQIRALEAYGHPNVAIKLGNRLMVLNSKDFCIYRRISQGKLQVALVCYNPFTNLLGIRS